MELPSAPGDLAEERDQLVYLTRRLAELFDELAIRGLRSLGPADLERLDRSREALHGLGAAHLADRVSRLRQAVEADQHSGAALLAARTSLELFERVLSREWVTDLLADRYESDEPDDEDPTNEEDGEP